MHPADKAEVRVRARIKEYEQEVGIAVAGCPKLEEIFLHLGSFFAGNQLQKHLVGAVPTPILPTQRLADAAPRPVS